MKRTILTLLFLSLTPSLLFCQEVLPNSSSANIFKIEQGFIDANCNDLL